MKKLSLAVTDLGVRSAIGTMPYDTDADVLGERPALATGLVVAVSFAGYLALTIVLDGTVRPVESALFAVAFTVVYVGFGLASQRFGE
jgi:hypothetical protein